MQNESPESDIVLIPAEHTCHRVAKRTVRYLQVMKDSNMLLFGNDSLLCSVWEEICVQVQFEEFWMWDAYVETLTVIVNSLV